MLTFNDLIVSEIETLSHGSWMLRVFRIAADGRLEHTQTLETNASPWWVVFQP